MSCTWALVCHTTRQKIWIGQGNSEMEGFYTGEPETMERLRCFLNETQGKPLEFICEDTNECADSYAEFGKEGGQHEKGYAGSNSVSF